MELVRLKLCPWYKVQCYGAHDRRGLLPWSSRSDRLGLPIKPCDPVWPVPDLSFGKVAPQIAVRPPVTETRQASVMQHWPSRLCVFVVAAPLESDISTCASPKKFGVGET